MKWYYLNFLKYPNWFLTKWTIHSEPEWEIGNVNCLAWSTVFMAFEIKSMVILTKLIPNDPNQLKKLHFFEFWGWGPSLCLDLQKRICPFLFYIYDSWCLRNMLVCQNHFSEQYFMPNSFHYRFSIPVHCKYWRNQRTINCSTEEIVFIQRNI